MGSSEVKKIQESTFEDLHLISCVLQLPSSILLPIPSLPLEVSLDDDLDVIPAPLVGTFLLISSH